MSTSDRLKYAQWIHERNLQWIAASDVKTAVVVAISTGMLGAMASAFAAVPYALHTLLGDIFVVIALLLLGFAIFCAAMTVFPRVSGPNTSFIFSRGIANQPQAAFLAAVRAATDEQLLDDCLTQIHRIAEIANQKFEWVRSGITSGLISVVPWVVALAALRS